MNDLPALIPARPPEPAGRAEFECGFCRRGQCARCRDPQCTCCNGNPDE